MNRTIGQQAIDDLFGHIPEREVDPLPDDDVCADCGSDDARPRELGGDGRPTLCDPCTEQRTGERLCCGVALRRPHDRRCPDRGAEGRDD